MKTRLERIQPALRPPVPKDQGPGSAEMTPVTLSSTDFEALDNRKVELVLSEFDSHLDAAFKALATASNSLGGFFTKATADGYVADEIWNLMQVYGRFRGPHEALSLGDLVQTHTRWSVVLSAGQRDITRAIDVQADSSGEWSYRVFDVRGGKFDAVTHAWQPLAQKVLSPSSQIGRFWGPNLYRYRAILYDVPHAIALQIMLDDVLSTTRYNSFSLEQFLVEIEAELYPYEAGLPLWPGSFLFTERDDEIAIVLSDSVTALGFSRHNSSPASATFMELAKFAPGYVWYPHP